MVVNKMVTSVTPPVDKFVGWLKPVNGKYLELYFFIDGKWKSINVEESSGGNTGGNNGDGITDIECNATYPLILSASTEDNKTTIVGSVDLDGYAQIDSIPTKVSQLENDANYLTNSDMVPITIEEVDALFD